MAAIQASAKMIITKQRLHQKMLIISQRALVSLTLNMVLFLIFRTQCSLLMVDSSPIPGTPCTGHHIRDPSVFRRTIQKLQCLQSPSGHVRVVDLFLYPTFPGNLAGLQMGSIRLQLHTTGPLAKIPHHFLGQRSLLWISPIVRN